MPTYIHTYIHIHTIYTQAVAGVFTALANIISLVIAGSTETAALAYFSCAVLIVLLCLVSLLVLTRLVRTGEEGWECLHISHMQ